MRRVTVRWHERAIDDLAELWLNAEDASKFERAANEIGQLLAFGPATKGRPFSLHRLGEEKVRLLMERAVVLPEDLQWMRCGPLELFFIAREDDCLAIVYFVQLRTGD